MSKAHTGLSYNVGIKFTKERRQNISNALSGRKVPQDIIEKIRKANKGKKRTGKALENLRGHVCSEEKKEKIRKALTGRKHTEETKMKMRKPKSEEHKINISLGHKRRKLL